MPTRRRLLHLCAAAGLYSQTPPLVLAALPGEYRLAVVILRGAWDGLDVVRPYGDRSYQAMRPPGAADSGVEPIDLDGFFSLHPALAAIHPMFKAKELSFVHAVATPYRNRSHFDGQDILEQGTATKSTESIGWLNRLLGLTGNSRLSYAMDISAGSDLILRGPNEHGNWYPDLTLNLAGDSEQFLRSMYDSDALLKASFAEIQQLRQATGKSGDIDPGVSPREMAKLAANYLNQDARIAAFSLTGWDTHINQEARLPPLLNQLSQMLLTFKESLGANWRRTAVIMCSEFGRTARFNGTRGTDHGTGGLAVLAGGLFANGKGGKILVNGKWPSLADDELYEGRDLMPTDDVRRYAAWLITALFNVDANQVSGTVFPGVDMGQNPGLI
jgi:uncharacterized protein (DUF1501 family)